MPDRGVILLVEDSEEDIILIRQAFMKASVNNPLFVVRDGEEVIRYLEGKDKYSNADEYPLPVLVLLDLKMPLADGFEVLKWIRQRQTLKALRIIVLTSSEYIRDVNRAYELGANSFLVKPVDFQDLIGLSRFLREFLQYSKTPEIMRPPKQRKPNGPTLGAALF